MGHTQVYSLGIASSLGTKLDASLGHVPSLLYQSGSAHAPFTEAVMLRRESVGSAMRGEITNGDAAWGSVTFRVTTFTSKSNI